MGKREILIITALKLFCDNGFHATGIDTILEHAKVSKATLYHYFNTKDDLIIACLENAHNIFIDVFINKINAMNVNPKNKILQIFQNLYDGTQDKDLIRCVFINASAEFSSLENPIHKVAMEHKISLQNFIETLATEAKIENPLNFARVCTTLSQGALAMAQVSGDKDYYRDAINAVKKLIEM